MTYYEFGRHKPYKIDAVLLAANVFFVALWTLSFLGDLVALFFGVFSWWLVVAPFMIALAMFGLYLNLRSAYQFTTTDSWHYKLAADVREFFIKRFNKTIY